MARTFTRTITTPAAARLVRPNARPVVSLLTDFGARDPSAGIMRAVVLTIAQDALVIDLSHEVEKFRVRDAALLLWCSVPYLPSGAHVAVVDPGVGTERRAIAIETSRGDFLVGPDNGLLMPAATRLGGITRVHQLTSSQYRLPVISSSFHGRDLFAPAAAHLAMGLPLEFLGHALDPRTLALLDWPEPQIFAGILRSQVIYLDTFGNVKLSAMGPDLVGALGQVQYGERLWLRMTDQYGSNDVEVTWVETFARVGIGQPLLYEDSYGRLSLAINQGSAVQAIGIREDAEVLVTRQQLPRVDAELAGETPAAVPEWSGAEATAEPGWPAEPQPWAPDQAWQPEQPPQQLEPEAAWQREQPPAQPDAEQALPADQAWAPAPDQAWQPEQASAPDAWQPEQPAADRMWQPDAAWQPEQQPAVGPWQGEPSAGMEPGAQPDAAPDDGSSTDEPRSGRRWRR